MYVLAMKRRLAGVHPVPHYCRSLSSLQLSRPLCPLCSRVDESSHYSPSVYADALGRKLLYNIGLGEREQLQSRSNEAELKSDG